MAFMRPVASYFAAYDVDTDSGSYIVPVDVCGARCSKKDLLRYTEGTEVYSKKKVKGWFARLSASGYMDATDWQGPYKTEKAALDAVKDHYEVDDEGDFDGGY